MSSISISSKHLLLLTLIMALQVDNELVLQFKYSSFHLNYLTDDLLMMSTTNKQQNKIHLLVLFRGEEEEDGA